MRSGFSARIIRSTKTVVLRSEQPETWSGRTLRHGVDLPSAKCMSATCKILNWPFRPKRSGGVGGGAGEGAEIFASAKTKTEKRERKRKKDTGFSAIGDVFLKLLFPSVVLIIIIGGEWARRRRHWWCVGVVLSPSSRKYSFGGVNAWIKVGPGIAIHRL